MKKLIAMLLAVLLLGAAALAEDWYYVVNPDSSWVNLRAEPSRKADVLAEVGVGEYVVLLDGSDPDWAWVEYGDIRGYMMRSFLRLEDGVQGEESYSEDDSSYSGEEGQGIAPGLVLLQQLGDRYIYRYEQDGHAICFVSEVEEPAITWEDVNFDGIADIVVMVNLGTSNTYYEFFIWDDGEYVYAKHAGEDALTNYQLLPEYGLVMCTGNNGMAGMLFETALYRWEGAQMVPIRLAVSEELTEWTDLPDGYTITTCTQTLHLRVWDLAAGENLLYEARVTLDELDEYGDALLEKVEKALWQGI